MKAAATAIGALALAAAAPAAARSVDYELDEEGFREAAAAIGAPEPAPAPERGGAEIVIENAERLDHRVMILGIACSAWTVDNRLSRMVRRALEGWDADGILAPAAGRPLLRVSIDSAGSDLRCVEVAEMSVRCLVRTRIDGVAILERPGAEPVTERISIEDRQTHTRPGACGTLSRGTALSGRAASLALVERLRALAAAH